MKCKCGCGKEFEQTDPPRLFLNRKHFLAYSRRTRFLTGRLSTPITTEQAELNRKKEIFHNWK